MPPPHRDRSLETLSTQLGVETRYRDQSGNWREVPPATLRALCRTLESAGRQRRSYLPPTVVAETSRRVRVPNRIPDSARRVRWTLLEDGRAVHESEADATDLRRGLALPTPPAAGYYTLELEWNGRNEGHARTMVIAVPRRAYLPPRLRNGKAWGLTAQLYALRSPRNWGIGDFGDLEALIVRAAAAGADVLGVNPLHALFAGEPERASPYSPSSRLFINPLYLDLERIEDFAECAAAQRLVGSAAVRSARQRLQERSLVDYGGTAELKHRVLRLLYESFREQHLRRRNDARADEFRAYQRQLGLTLRRFATFEVVCQAHGGAAGRSRSWRRWPAELRHPSSPAIARFAQQHREEIELVEYQQWQANRQLARIACTAETAAMAVGLYQDLAVGFDPEGADAWSFQEVVAQGWSVGAPPDAWSPKGQDWGLAPLNPHRLYDAAYAPFIETLRANMRHAGALRIDHILGLKRAFWVPQGGAPADGVYVRYPFADLLGIVALESVRQHCVVVGEDLGTVPPGFSDELRRRGMLSYRLLYFSRTAAGSFERPKRYPRQALAAVTTHDLPTIAGYWRGDDIALRARLNLYPQPRQARRDRAQRASDRRALLRAFAAENLPVRPNESPVNAAHRFLARTPARIMMAQIEDLLAVREQVNVPGTVTEHPNWRRKLPLTVEELFRDPRIRRHLATLAAERPTPAGAGAGSPAMPRSTYRLQLNREFPFGAAAAIVPYLAQLGVSHLYLSPIFEAKRGSTHGYDTTSFDRLNPELGGEMAFRRFVDDACDHGLRLVVDFVPNHMGIGFAQNEWWLDLLEWGRASPAAEIFDVDWTPAAWPELQGKVSIPVLGGSYDSVLRRRELDLRFDATAGSLAVWYHEHCFPIRPSDYPVVLSSAADRLRQRSGARTAAQVAQLSEAFAILDHRRESRRDAAALKEVLARWVSRTPLAASAIRSAIAEMNLRVLDGLLRKQVYRLTSWRTAGTCINYRRFFDINQLASIRMERLPVFERCHRAIEALLREGQVHGLRLDHVDGLYDPAEYLRRLRRLARRSTGVRRSSYIVVEKILGRDEDLRRDWPVEGTTGYEFANWVNGVLVDSRGKDQLSRTYKAFTGEDRDFGQELLVAKRLVVRQLFGGELTALAARIARIAPRGFDLETLKTALADVVAAVPIYRTYVTRRGSTSRDRQIVAHATAEAQGQSQVRDARIFRFLRGVLTAQIAARAPTGQYREIRDIAIRFQQLTAPVQAKALEDTAFYRYARLLSLNEVGGDPGCFGTPLTAFHGRMRRRAHDWPHSMLTTATHDTKRGEDARARISVLSEIPAAWTKAVSRWSTLNRAATGKTGSKSAPSANDEYLIYQALLGAWPTELTKGRALSRSALKSLAERLSDYVQKVVREAKLRSSWTDPDHDYEAACRSFVARILDPSRSRRFLDEFSPFAATVARCGALNSLSQVALKLLLPGVPDIYQGCELWDLSFVDPDNRRPVSFDERRRHLEDMAAHAPSFDWQSLGADWRSGRIKLCLTWRLLALRRAEPQLFAAGTYAPLRVAGRAADHVIAFQRRYKGKTIVVAVGRWFAGLPADPGAFYPRPQAWRRTCLQGISRLETGINMLTGVPVTLRPREEVHLDELFRELPLAVIAQNMA